MKYLKSFNESVDDDEVISHFAFLTDLGFNIFKPIPGRYVIHKLTYDNYGVYRIVHFKIGVIKEEILPIMNFFKISKINLSSYYNEFDGDGKSISIEDFENLDDDILINRIIFDL